MKMNEKNDWNAEQYLKFAAIRTRPSRDLAAQIASEPRTVLDIGCGPGNSTAVLVERFPVAHITGIDSSPDMLETARAAHPGIDFRPLSLSPDCRELNEDYDLIFSNACFQWIPDHRQFLPALWRHVTEGGTLAFQIPLTDAMPITPILEKMKTSAVWGAYLAAVHDLGTLGQNDYFSIARSLSPDCTLWRTDYAQPVHGIAGVIDWYMGSRLRPFVAAVPESRRAAFVDEVAAHFSRAYSPSADGTVLMWFPRLFVVIHKI